MDIRVEVTVQFFLLAVCFVVHTHRVRLVDTGLFSHELLATRFASPGRDGPLVAWSVKGTSSYEKTQRTEQNQTEVEKNRTEFID